MSKSINFDGATYNPVEGVRFASDPSKVFYDTDIASASAATASDIKSGKQAVVNGQKLTGTHTDETVDLIALDATMNNHQYVAPSGKAYSVVRTNIATSTSLKTQEKSVDMDNGQQYMNVLPDVGYDAMTRVGVNVYAGVDRNIQPYNIKKGVSILGMLGTFEGKTEVKPGVYMKLNKPTYSSGSLRFYVIHPEIDSGSYGDCSYRAYGKRTSASSWTTGDTGHLKWDEEYNCAYVDIKVTTTTNAYNNYQNQFKLIIGAPPPLVDGNPRWYMLIDAPPTTRAGSNWYAGESTGNTSYLIYEGDGYSISETEMSEAPTLSPQTGVGTFTPVSSDYVSGGRIKIPWMGKPRAVMIWREGGFDGAELYEPVKYMMFNPSGDGIHYMSLRFYANPSNSNGYGSAGNPDLDATEFPMTDDATSNGRCIFIGNDGVYFKTYGDYRFRVGKTYNYEIY